MIWGSGGSKSRLAKAAGCGASRSDERWKIARRCGAKHISKSKCAKHLRFGALLEVEMLKKCTPLWREARFQVKMYKTHHSRTTFGSWDVEKVHAVVARSTFPSQNVQNTPFSDHFWKLRCRKSARRCGEKHISTSKCTKHTMFGPLLEVQMSKKCMPLWREAHFHVKMYKTHHVRTTFGGSDVEKVHAVVARSTFPRMYKTHHVRTTFGGSDVEKVHAVVARSTFPSQNVKITRGLDHFWRFRSRFASLDYTTLHSTTLHFTTLHYTALHYTTTTTTQLHSTTLHYTKLHFTTLHYTTLHYTTLHYTKLHYTSPHYTTLLSTTLHYTTLPSTTLHYITLHFTTLQLQLHNYTPLHSTTLNYTTLNYTTLNYTTLLYSTLHYTTLHYTTRHSTTLHYTTLHYSTLHYTEWHCTTDRQVDR